jgi:hypothetical protein
MVRIVQGGANRTLKSNGRYGSQHFPGLFRVTWGIFLPDIISIMSSPTKHPEVVVLKISTKNSRLSFNSRCVCCHAGSLVILRGKLLYGSPSFSLSPSCILIILRWRRESPGLHDVPSIRGRTSRLLAALLGDAGDVYHTGSIVSISDFVS